MKKDIKKRIHYSFLTIILSLLVVQIGLSAGYNVLKVVSLKHKIKVSKQIKQEETTRNKDLAYSVNNWNEKSAEAILRSKFKLARKDETFVILPPDKELQAELEENTLASQEHEFLSAF